MKIRGEACDSAEAESSNLGARILLVEDQPFVRESTALLLRAHGYEVATVAEAREALEIFAKDDGFDLLLADIVMPGSMNGVELAQAIRERSSVIKVVLFSGYSRDELLRTEVIERETVMLPKPFSVEDLENAITTAFGRVKR